MKKIVSLLLIVLGVVGLVKSQELPVRGFCVAAPSEAQLNTFIKFIDEELAPRKVNTLVLRVDFNYEFKSRPELREKEPLSKKTS